MCVCVCVCVCVYVCVYICISSFASVLFSFGDFICMHIYTYICLCGDNIVYYISKDAKFFF